MDEYKRRRRRRQSVLSVLLGNDPVLVEGDGLITFDANGEAVESLKVYFDPVQSFNGYDHPWPAGGGKNLIKNEWRQGNYRSQAYTDIVTTAEFPLVEVGETYSISVLGLDFTVYKYVVFGSEVATGTSNTARPDSGWLTGQSSTIVPIATNPYIGISIARIDGADLSPSDLPTTLKIQVEKGSTSTAWTPFENICPITGWTGLYVYHSGADTSDYDTIPVTWSDHGTVYGGYVDVVTGELWATDGTLTKNTADMDNSSAYPGWRNSGIKALIGDGVNGRIDNVFSNVSPDTGSVASIGANTLGSSDILILFENYFNKTQEDWIALSMDVQVCVPLATPVLVATLTPQTLDLLQGENNIWSNTGGHIELTYTPS